MAEAGINMLHQHPQCSKFAQSAGMCVQHGYKKKQCSDNRCTNNVVRNGVCINHGTKRYCTMIECGKPLFQMGKCRFHFRCSLAASTAATANAQKGAARPPHPARGYEATVVITSAIAGGGSGEIDIDTHNLQTDASPASSCRSPSLRPSITAPNFSEDDEDIIGAWTWRSSNTARLGSANNTNGAL